MPPKRRSLPQLPLPTSEDDGPSVGNARPGPATLAELLQYPKQVLDDVICSEGEKLHRLTALLDARIVVTSDYSGMRCWEQ
eukprot:4863594-Alexandrium_andersonii.AAC.1